MRFSSCLALVASAALMPELAFGLPSFQKRDDGNSTLKDTIKGKAGDLLDGAKSSLGSLAGGTVGAAKSIVSASTVKAALATVMNNGVDRQYKRGDVAAGDVRSPCPALNSLANHGYM
jgi:Peroxidase, family 2